MEVATPEEMAEVTQQLDDMGDIYFHSGPIQAPADAALLELVARRSRDNDRATLYLRTHGGVAEVAYRMMRALQHAYEYVTVVLWGPCMSAGTLMVLGANELVMTGDSQLGPIDVQILTKDEVLDRRSGLLPQAAFQSLRGDAIAAWRDLFLEMKVGGNLATSTATETATRLTVGLFAPIFAQVDPIQVGEFYLANAVGQSYGQRLLAKGGNAPESTLYQLLSTYPAHNFVIDRTEADELFNCLRPPNRVEREFIAAARRGAIQGTQALTLQGAIDDEADDTDGTSPEPQVELPSEPATEGADAPAAPGGAEPRGADASGSSPGADEGGGSVRKPRRRSKAKS